MFNSSDIPESKTDLWENFKGGPSEVASNDMVRVNIYEIPNLGRVSLAVFAYMGCGTPQIVPVGTSARSILYFLTNHGD